MHTIKKVGTQKKLLSKIPHTIVDLSVENGRDDFDFLSDDLQELLKEKLKENNLEYEDLKINYSLSYCQGDGFCFQGTIDTDKARFKITHYGHYYHYNSKNIEIICLFKGKDKEEVYSEDFTDKEDKTAEKYADEFNELYVDICKEMEKIGYECIEDREQDNIAQQGFRDWKEQNDIVSDVELYDIDYLVVDYWNKEKKDLSKYVLICESGDTSVRLYIKDRKIETTDYVKATADITEYKENSFVFKEDKK